MVCGGNRQPLRTLIVAIIVHLRYSGEITRGTWRSVIPESTNWAWLPRPEDLSHLYYMYVCIYIYNIYIYSHPEVDRIWHSQTYSHLERNF